jgi:UDPglucose 6-dehydrogenase
MKIGIIGYGFVGKATELLDKGNCLIYDVRPNIGNCSLETIVNEADIIFICVPTPMFKNGKCCTDIVKKVIDDIRSLKNDCLICVRSTVPIGFCEKMGGVYFMPEFLTERNWADDFKKCNCWIFGGEDEHFKRIIGDIIGRAYGKGVIDSNKIRFCPTGVAEGVKMFRNNILATKVAFCNEFYDYCKMRGIEYEKVRELAVLDNRIGASHTLVPGLDGLRGFGGTCFPKDLESILYDLGDESIVLEAVKRRNLKDREEKDWENLIGRSVL